MTGRYLGFLAAGLFSFVSTAKALNLGGTEVPKEKMVVYLMIGHSNMAGQDIQHSDDVTNPKVWNYAWNRTKQWELAKEPKGSRANGLSGHGCGGPSMPFLKGLATAYPDKYFGVISNASLSATCKGENLGNSSSDLPKIENRYWKGTILYNELVTIAKEIQKDVTFGGVVCMLGSVEATRTSLEVCNSMGTDLATFATDLRTDLGLPDMPFLMGGYEAGASGTFKVTLPMPAAVDAQIKLLPTLLTRSAVIDSKGIEMLDDHHYTAIGGEGEFAKRAIAIIKEKNWMAGSATNIVQMPANQGRKHLLSYSPVDEAHAVNTLGQSLANSAKAMGPHWIMAKDAAKPVIKVR